MTAKPSGDIGNFSLNIDLEKGKSAKTLVEDTRTVFQSQRTKPFSFRKRQLEGVLQFVTKEEQALCEALYEDLKKCKHETILQELNLVANETRHFIKNLKKWMQPEHVPSKLITFFDNLSIHSDPYGVVLIISPWNYPISCLLLPLIGAIAGGNCVIIKPSEVASATAQVIAHNLPRYIDSECYPVYLGGIEETTELLKERFDYIFFTGSTPVGKLIHKAASRYLTPTTLELGGKSPVFIDKSANLKTAVKRILWGKIQNAGQVCVAPDYILCSKEVQAKVITHAEEVLQEFFGDDIKKSKDFGRIINIRNFNRVSNYLKGQKVILGGSTDQRELYVQPTLITDIKPDNPIRNEEIFGPILPIFNVESVEEAIEFINNGEKPLALYVFTKKDAVKKAFLEKTSSGGVVINDAVLQFATEGLPFGGVGESGMGAYHGKKSFDTFVHKKSVLSRGYCIAIEKLFSTRYPPYSDFKLKFLSTALRYNLGFPKCLSQVCSFGLGVAVTIGGYYLSQYLQDDKLHN